MKYFELAILLPIILIFVAGSCGVFDAKAQNPVAVDSCAEWVKVPAPLRIQILRYGMVTEIMKADLGSEIESLIGCLSEREHMMMLDEDIVAQCAIDESEERLAEVFDRSLERIVFRCMKWVHEGT